MVRSEDLFICRCDGGADRLFDRRYLRRRRRLQRGPDRQRHDENHRGSLRIAVSARCHFVNGADGAGVQFHYRSSDRDGMGRHGADCQRAGAEDEA